MPCFCLSPKCGQVALVLCSVHVCHARDGRTPVPYCGSAEIASVRLSSLRRHCPTVWTDKVGSPLEAPHTLPACLSLDTLGELPVVKGPLGHGNVLF